MLQLDDDRIEKFENMFVLQRRMYPHLLVNVLAVLLRRVVGELDELACGDAVFFDVDCAIDTANWNGLVQV